MTSPAKEFFEKLRAQNEEWETIAFQMLFLAQRLEASLLDTESKARAELAAHKKIHRKVAAAFAGETAMRGDVLREWMQWYQEIAQLLDGWHQDGTAWTEWDTPVRDWLIRLGAMTVSVLGTEGKSAATQVPAQPDSGAPSEAPHPQPAPAADPAPEAAELPHTLMGERLDEYAYGRLQEACSAWSNVRDANGISKAACEYARAQEGYAKGAISELWEHLVRQHEALARAQERISEMELEHNWSRWLQDCARKTGVTVRYEGDTLCVVHGDFEKDLERAEAELAKVREERLDYEFLLRMWPLEITRLCHSSHEGPTDSEVHGAVRAARAALSNPPEAT